jgi:hypothetical protein
MKNHVYSILDIWLRAILGAAIHSQSPSVYYFTAYFFAHDYRR